MRSDNSTDCKPCERPSVDGVSRALVDVENSTRCIGGNIRLVKQGFWRKQPLSPCGSSNASAQQFVYKCVIAGDCPGMTDEQEHALNTFLETHNNDWTLVSDAMALADAQAAQAAGCGDGRRLVAEDDDGSPASIVVNMTESDDGSRVMLATFVELNDTLEITLDGCAAGHTGPLCAVCGVDYARSGAAPGSDEVHAGQMLKTPVVQSALQHSFVKIRRPSLDMS